MNCLKGKKVIITGGSRGLGKATAIALANEGLDVAITGRTEESLKSTVQELSDLGVNAIYAVFDIGNHEAVKASVEDLITRLGGVDILINNAGIAAFGTLNDMDSAQWVNIIQTNLMGMYFMTKEVLPHLISQNQGDIINVSSTAGLNGNASTSAYSASKFAVIGMSQSLMKEVRKNNIRVCTLTPSTIVSDMSVSLGIADKDSEDSVLQPEDFAALIVSGLKLPRRAMMANASLWSTNP